MNKSKNPLLNSIEEYEKIKKQIFSKKNSQYIPEIVSKKLHDDENLRSIYLAVANLEPCIVSEIQKESSLSKQTCYNILHRLIKLNLVLKIHVLDVIKKVIENKDIEEKFDKWTKNMPENVKNYYLGRTNYWIITPNGKQFLSIAYSWDQEFREKRHEQI